jgi:hypothetical protein
MLARSPSALKKRRYRRRLRDGVIVLKLEICEVDLVEALLLSGRLGNAAAEARSALERAAEDVLTEWCARWLQRKP